MELAETGMSPRNAFWGENLGRPIDPAHAHSSFSSFHFDNKLSTWFAVKIIPSKSPLSKMQGLVPRPLISPFPIAAETVFVYARALSAVLEL